VHGVACVEQWNQHKLAAVQFRVGNVERFGADGAVVVKEQIKVNDPRAPATVGFGSAEFVFNFFARATKIFGLQRGVNEDDAVVKPVLLFFADRLCFIDSGGGGNGCTPPVTDILPKGFLQMAGIGLQCSIQFRIYAAC